jgi:hypothetical protein
MGVYGKDFTLADFFPGELPQSSPKESSKENETKAKTVGNQFPFLPEFFKVLDFLIDPTFLTSKTLSRSFLSH